MKRIILITIFVFLMCSFSSAQSLLPEFEKVKQIKLLETSRDEVREIFADYCLEPPIDSEYYQRFSTKNSVITVSYSNGSCSKNDEETDGWNVPEWIVTDINISLEKSVKIQEFGIDFSKYRKERMFSNLPDSYMYHNKDLGIAFQVDENEIEEIHLIPQKKDYPLFCDIEVAKKHALNKSWFIGSLKERISIIDKNDRPSIVDMMLSHVAIFPNCNLSDLTQNKTCEESNLKINVLVTAVDPENDTVIYHYKVSGGKIIGQGASVIWDLTGVKAGVYTITADVDDGCGLCGKSVIRSITIYECSDCEAK